MSKKWHRKVVQAKREVSYGVDPTLAGANALVLYDLEYTPGFDYTQAKRVLPYLARQKTDVAKIMDRISFWVEAAGAGAAGSAPAYGTLLRASSFAEVLDPGVDAQYSPVSTADESASFAWSMDGLQHVFRGARGTLNAIRFAGNELPRFGFEFIGLPLAPTDTVLPIPDFTAWQPGVVVNKANTTILTLHAFAVAMSQLAIDMGTVLVHRDMPNANDVQATDREPAGSITFDVTTVAQLDYFAAVKAGTFGALALSHGVGAGNIVQLDAPAVQLTNPRYSNVDAIAAMTLDLGLHPDAGNDELLITVK